MALVKRIKIDDKIIYKLIKDHNIDCINKYDSDTDKREKIVENYQNYYERCFEYMNSQETYNRQSFKNE